MGLGPTSTSPLAYRYHCIDSGIVRPTTCLERLAWTRSYLDNLECWDFLYSGGITCIIQVFVCVLIRFIQFPYSTHTPHLYWCLLKYGNCMFLQWELYGHCMGTVWVLYGSCVKHNQNQSLWKSEMWVHPIKQIKSILIHPIHANQSNPVNLIRSILSAPINPINPVNPIQANPSSPIQSNQSNLIQSIQSRHKLMSCVQALGSPALHCTDQSTPWIP